MDEKDTQYVHSVFEINSMLRTSVSQLFDNIIAVHGETSNVKLSRGNLFFTLKGTNAALNIMFWNYSKQNTNIINDGDKVIIYGKISCYVKSGTINFTCEKIIQSGDVGDNHKLYEKMKKIFMEKGYFDENKKKQMPKIIKNIGIITAKDGAAIQDVLYVLNKNNFKGNVHIKNCIVQGNDCPINVASSIQYFKKNKIDIDILLITRGGGAFEDLMGFSDEIVIDTIYNSDTFIISAIGHEVDNMLSDYVSDYRAPTPSIAAEVISSYWKNISGTLDICKNYMLPQIKLLIDKYVEHKKNNLLNIKKQVFDKIIKKINEHRETLNCIKHDIISKMNYDDIIKKSHHVIMDDNMNIISDVLGIQYGQKLKIKIKNTTIDVIVNKIQTDTT